MNKKTMEKIVNILLNILIVIFSIVLLISLYNTIQIKVFKNKYSNFFGYSIFEIQTNSMADEILTDDWIVVKLTKKVEINDIITYHDKGKFTTHRVVEKYKDTYVTMGDANNTKDEPIDSDQIVGKVTKILSKFGIYRKTLFDKQVLLALIGTLVIISLLFKKNNKDNENKDKEEQDDDTLKDDSNIDDSKFENTSVYSFYDEPEKKKLNIFKRKKTEDSKPEKLEEKIAEKPVLKVSSIDEDETEVEEDVVPNDDFKDEVIEREEKSKDSSIISIELDDENIDRIAQLKIEEQEEEARLAAKALEQEEKLAKLASESGDTGKKHHSEIIGSELSKLAMDEYDQEKYFEAINNLNQINEIEAKLGNSDDTNEIGIITVNYDDDDIPTQEEKESVGKESEVTDGEQTEVEVEETELEKVEEEKSVDTSVISVEVNSLDEEEEESSEPEANTYVYSPEDEQTISVFEDEIAKTKQEIEMYRQKSLQTREEQDALAALEKQKKIDLEKEKIEKEKLDKEAALDAKKLTRITLDSLNKRKKKSKNIIDKIMFSKSEKLEEVIRVLDDEEAQSNEPTIREKFIESYNDALYYNHYEVETKKIDAVLKRCAEKLIKAYKGNDKKYAEKVSKNLSHFLLIGKLETTNLSKKTTKEKNDFCKNEIEKYSKDKEWTKEKINYVYKEIKEIQNKYFDVMEYILKNMQTETFKLEFNPLKTNKHMFGIEMSHNVPFDKFYSDFVIDETYKTGIIAENKINVLINLLLNELVKDMLLGTFERKYLLYIPESLYSKQTKIKSMFKLFDDKYAKENIIISTNYKTFIKSRKIIREARKQGYKFAVVITDTDEINETDKKHFRLADIIFTSDKDKTKKIPNDYFERIILEDITEKLGDFEGRGE